MPAPEMAGAHRSPLNFYDNHHAHDCQRIALTRQFGRQLICLFTATKFKDVLGITHRCDTRSARLLQRFGFQLKESKNSIFCRAPCREEIYAFSRNKG